MAQALVSAYFIFEVPGRMRPPGPPEVTSELGPVTVERVGTRKPGTVHVNFVADVWAIRWTPAGRCWSRNGGWALERIPSERTEEWKAEHRFSLVEAAELLEVEFTKEADVDGLARALPAATVLHRPQRHRDS